MHFIKTIKMRCLFILVVGILN